MQSDSIMIKEHTNEVHYSKKNDYLITTTITISMPDEIMAEYIGFPAVLDGSPSSL
jgi:hypothetical protein